MLRLFSAFVCGLGLTAFALTAERCGGTRTRDLLVSGTSFSPGRGWPCHSPLDSIADPLPNETNDRATPARCSIQLSYTPFRYQHNAFGDASIFAPRPQAYLQLARTRQPETGEISQKSSNV
jgi:hypothetical protein